MSTSVQTPIASTPDWVVSEMPPGYQNRMAEIRRLTEEMQSMTRFGRLLTDLGAPLGESVRDLFASLQLQSEVIPGSAGTGVVVSLEGRGLLLFRVASDERTIQKRSPEMMLVFQLLQELAGDRDRVIFVTNADPQIQPSERSSGLAPDAAAFLNRMGAAHVTASTLFSLWKLSLDEPERAREVALRLHAHENGTFELPSYARLK